MFASEHTRLVNKFIGLCKDSIYWPKILFELGYEVQLIEPTINLKNSQKINPDVVAVSKKLSHAIITECKSGNNINNEQDTRYHELTSDDLKYQVTIHDITQLKHAVCYVVNHNNYKILSPHTKFPFIIFNHDEIQGQRDFGIKQLTKKLCVLTSLKCMKEPTGYYPFSPDDEDDVIVPHVLRGLISYLLLNGKKAQSQTNISFDTEKILELIHPHNLINTRHNRNLIKKIENTINICLKKYSDFNKHVLKIKNGVYNSSTLQKFRDICNEIIEDYENQKIQKKIDSY